MTTPGAATPASEPTAGGPDGGEGLTFPRQAARTRRFRLGAPRSFTVSPDAGRVIFLRSSSGTDPANALLVLDLSTGAERLVADPRALLGGDDDPASLPAEERARRERMREMTAGITAYSADAAATVAAFALAGRLFAVGLADGAPAPRELDVPGPVVDPRVSPDGRHVAWSAGRALHVAAIDGSDHRVLASPESPTAAHGLVDFIAAEELDRSRGFWWSPASDAVLCERWDEAPVPVWWISDPAHPERPAAEHRYPHAGAANPEVSLHLLGLDGSSREVVWDRAAFEYLATVSWVEGQDPLVSVLSRDQRTMLALAVDPASGEARTVLEATDPCWVDVVPGVPTWSPDGRLVHAVDDDGTRRIAVDGAPLTPAGLQVAEVVHVGADGVVVAASEEPTARRLVRVGWDGATEDLTPADGWHSGVVGAGALVHAAAGLERPGTVVVVRRPGHDPVPVVSHAQRPVVDPRPVLLRTGPRGLATAVLLPAGHEPGSEPLPVLMSPYGGPHGQRVMQAASAYSEDQWLADQGFAVVVADGRGTPGRGPVWEREVFGDLATAVLDDQVDALLGAAAAFPGELDLGRVGIRGWSFGGYLAALAVLRRPDVFHAAVAGAPVTDWRRYDSAYTERYLGHPDAEPGAYEASSLIGDAAGLTRPLLLIHGLADDNVVAAHTLALSGALLAAGRAHSVLPLTGVTHMTPQEVVAENLLHLQRDFLREHLHA